MSKKDITVSSEVRGVLVKFLEYVNAALFMSKLIQLLIHLMTVNRGIIICQVIGSMFTEVIYAICLDRVSVTSCHG